MIRSEIEDEYTCMRGHVTVKPVVSSHGYMQCRECHRLFMVGRRGKGEYLKKPDMKRENNPNWVGDNASYTAKHKRIYVAKGKAPQSVKSQLTDNEISALVIGGITAHNEAIDQTKATIDRIRGEL